MANDVTHEKYWILDTVAELAAAGTSVLVQKIVFVPTTKDHSATIQDYSSAAALRQAAYLKAGATDASPVSLDFGEKGRYFNGFKLSAISAGAIHVYLV